MMSLFKPRQAPAAQAGATSRRSFIWKMGAGASAVASVGVAHAAAGAADDPALQVALLQEEKALRQLHQAFEQAMERGDYDAVIGMFAEDAEVVFNGGVFSGRQGVGRLYRGHFAAGNSGRRMEPAPGFELAADQQHDRVQVAADLRSAEAQFTYSIQVGMPIETESSLAAMARLHGEGVRTWWEGGVYRVSYRRDAEDRWRISHLEYDTLSRADYRPGKRYAQPIAVARLAATFPVDPRGPDRLV